MKGQTCTVRLRERQERDSEYTGISYELDEERGGGRETDRQTEKTKTETQTVIEGGRERGGERERETR